MIMMMIIVLRKKGEVVQVKKWKNNKKFLSNMTKPNLDMEKTPDYVVIFPNWEIILIHWRPQWIIQKYAKYVEVKLILCVEYMEYPFTTQLWKVYER